MTFKTATGLLVLITLPALAGCNSSSVLPHKLVVIGGQHTVPLYPDEATYLKVSHRAQEGGVNGMIGNAQKDMSAKEIDDQTPVQIISSDSNGAVVQVVQGPMKGATGFAPSQNVD